MRELEEEFNTFIRTIHLLFGTSAVNNSFSPGYPLQDISVKNNEPKERSICKTFNINCGFIELLSTLILRTPVEVTKSLQTDIVKFNIIFALMDGVNQNSFLVCKATCKRKQKFFRSVRKLYILKSCVFSFAYVLTEIYEIWFTSAEKFFTNLKKFLMAFEKIDILNGAIPIYLFTWSYGIKF